MHHGNLRFVRALFMDLNYFFFEGDIDKRSFFQKWK